MVSYHGLVDVFRSFKGGVLALAIVARICQVRTRSKSSGTEVHGIGVRVHFFMGEHVKQ